MSPAVDSTAIRAACRVSPPSSYARFVLTQPTYAPQYAQLYFARLITMRPVVKAAALSKWGPPTGGETPGNPISSEDAKLSSSQGLHYADQVLAATAKPGVDAVVVGVLFRELPAKPSILQEYCTNSTELMPSPPARTLLPYAPADASPSSTNRVFLEDETGRFALDVSNAASRFRALVTGMVIAVRGQENRATGTFTATDVALAGHAPQTPLRALGADRYVCIVSGLGLGMPSMRGALATELLLDYLRACVGDAADRDFCATIAHLIVAGNCVAAPAALASADGGTAAALLRPHAAATGADVDPAVAAPVVHMDRFLTAVAAALPVSVMPGEDDPTGLLLPQQPVHRCLLPSASREGNLERVTNPYERDFEGRTFLGSSGQNVRDLVLYDAEAATVMAETCANAVCSGIRGESGGNGKGGEGKLSAGDVALGALETMLECRHMAPTAPDTLGAYPFYDSDPFIVERAPHVFFAGNQPEFASRIVAVPATKREVREDGEEVGGEGMAERKTLLVSVPRFSDSGVAVLVNLRTLACSTIGFSDEMLDMPSVE